MLSKNDLLCIGCLNAELQRLKSQQLQVFAPTQERAASVPPLCCGSVAQASALRFCIGFQTLLGLRPVVFLLGVPFGAIVIDINARGGAFVWCGVPLVSCGKPYGV